MAAVMVLSRESGRIRKETLILAGIVVSTFLAALISLIKSLDEESLSAIVFWIMGSFSGRGWGGMPGPRLCSMPSWMGTRYWSSTRTR